MFFSEQEIPKHEIIISLNIDGERSNNFFCVNVDKNITQKDFYALVRRKVSRFLMDDNELVIDFPGYVNEGYFSLDKNSPEPFFKILKSRSVTVANDEISANNWHELNFRYSINRIVQTEKNQEGLRSCCAMI